VTVTVSSTASCQSRDRRQAVSWSGSMGWQHDTPAAAQVPGFQIPSVGAVIDVAAVVGCRCVGYICGVLTPVLLVVAALSSSPVVCGTPALRSMPAGAAFAVGLQSRPDDDVFEVFDSTTLPLRVQRTTAAATVLAQNALLELEAAWQLQVVEAGYAPPLGDDGAGGSDALDVYLAPLPQGISAVTVAGDDVDDAADHDRRPTFIVVNPDATPEVFFAALHHEFQHALQYAIDAHESVMWSEATAVAFEVRGHPEFVSWQDALPSFQSQPQAPLWTDGAAFAAFATSTDPRLEYGAGLFALYLDDTYGAGDGTLLRRLWTGAAGHTTTGTGDDAVVVNTPDWGTALAEVAGIADVQRDFFVWRALAPPLGVDDEGPDAYALGGNVGLRGRRLNLEALRGVERTTNTSEGPFVGGCYVGTATATTSDVPLLVQVESVDGHALAVSFVVVADGAFSRSDAVVGSVVEHSVTVPAGADVVLGICDVSAADVDDAPVFAPVRLALTNTALPPLPAEGEGEGEGEGEVADDDVVDPGCACDSTSTGPAAGDPRVMRKSVYAMGFFVGVIGFAVKALRHGQRKRLYRKSNATKAAAEAAKNAPK
jgi:hypothetical protein